VEVSLEPKRTVELRVKVEAADGTELTSDLMDVPLGFTVKELRKMMANVAGCAVNKLDMFYHDPEGPTGPDKLTPTFLERKLHSFRMKDGDELLVFMK